ncbi:MAG: hypothetical protein ACRD4S_00800 [Candidatus Acidiferrales bacterium]
MWIAISVAAIVIAGPKLPLDRPSMNQMSTAGQVINSFVSLVAILLLMMLVEWLARHRPLPDLAARAPDRSVALRETIALWVYGAAVLVAGHFLGLRLFGGGIGLHLNGSLFGATRVQSPHEVYTWAAYNFVLLAVIPYGVFRFRGYSRESLNLRSSNLRNDILVIAVVLGIGILLAFTGPNIFQLTPHQQLVGGLLSFTVHLFGTDLPIMIFIYAILLPRYFKLASPATAYLLGAASYPVMHVFEYWTRYDTPSHAVLSVIFVFLTLFPAGLMKSFLTMRTGNAWVHLWAFHAIVPHVTLDTRLLVHDFHIR